MVGSRTAGGAVVAVGPAEDGVDAIAVWRVDQAGRPTGAWIQPQARVLGDREVARRLLVLLERCAITAADPHVVAEVVGKLTVTAEIDGPAGWWSSQTFTDADCVADVIARREELERTVSARRDSGRSAAPIDWTRDLDNAGAFSQNHDYQTVRSMAGVEVIASSPVATAALDVVHVLRWISELWAETEQVKNRRPYVMEAHGAVEALPPSWASAGLVAHENRLPL